MRTYRTENEALVAARAYWRGADLDLIYEDENGQWAFDIRELDALRDCMGDPKPETPIMTTHNEIPEQTESDAAEEVLENEPKPVEQLTKRERQRQAREEREHAKQWAREQRVAVKAAAKKAQEDERTAKAAATAAERNAKRQAAAEERLRRQEERQTKREARWAASAERLEAAEKRSAATEERRAQEAARKAEAAEERLRKRAELKADRDARSQNGVARPNDGTKLANLWTLIDAMRGEDGSIPTFREYRDEAMGIDYALVGSPGTITTAYYDYRVFHGIKSAKKGE
jgi:hypothetical protein